MPTFSAILRKHKLRPPLLYGISSRNYFPELDPVRYLELIFSTRAQIIQWREKGLAAAQSHLLARRGADLAGRTGKLFLINGDLELALEEAADGVHLPSSASVAEARQQALGRSVGSHFLFGQSAHSLAEAVEAEQDGADYVLLGPIFEPLSKISGRTPLGLQGLRQAVRELQIPVFALGGLEAVRLEEISRAGAAGLAGISWLRAECEKLRSP